jgi:hypothetical protein
MSVLKLEPFPQFSRHLEHNKWADYVELLCLNSTDKEISLNDIVTIYKQEGDIDISGGDEDHSKKEDSVFNDFSEIFKYIFSRINFLDAFYPFEKIDDDTIRMKEVDDKKMLYLFLLFASNTGYLSKENRSEFTMSFERISIYIMKTLYPNFQNEIFGTTTQTDGVFHGGLLVDRLKKLSVCFNTALKSIAANNGHYQSSAGDAGIDLVSFKNVDFSLTQSFMLPVCLVQCSCSYSDWSKKQSEIQSSAMNNIFENIAVYHEYIFVPFSLRGINGKWASEEAVKIRTIVIDRFRFLYLISTNTEELVILLKNHISTNMKKVLEEIDEYE